MPKPLENIETPVTDSLDQTQECDNCSANVESLIDINGDQLCQDCADEFTVCSNCHDNAPNDEGQTVDSEFYCEDCYNDTFFCCEWCEHTAELENAQTVNAYRNGRRSDFTVCEDCIENDFTSCNDCSAVVSNDDSFNNANDDPVCQNCYDNNYFTCESCNSVLHTDNYGEDSNCQSCIDENRDDEDGDYKKILSDTFKVNPFKRLFGIELEFLSKVSPDVKDYGFIKYDGSVNVQKDSEAGYSPHEFASHILNGDKGFQVIDSVCNEMKTAESLVNTTCGFHVHINMEGRDRNAQLNVYHAFQRFESLFLLMVAPSRRDNTYCRPVFGEAFGQGGRYRTLNVTAFSSHKTFEFRLHQGTVNAEKVKNWVSILLYLVTAYQDIDTTSLPRVEDNDRLMEFWRVTGLPLKLRKYMVERIKTFKEEARVASVVADRLTRLTGETQNMPDFGPYNMAMSHEGRPDSVHSQYNRVMYSFYPSGNSVTVRWFDRVTNTYDSHVFPYDDAMVAAQNRLNAGLAVWRRVREGSDLNAMEAALFECNAALNVRVLATEVVLTRYLRPNVVEANERAVQEYVGTNNVGNPNSPNVCVTEVTPAATYTYSVPLPGENANYQIDYDSTNGQWQTSIVRGPEMDDTPNLADIEREAE